MLYPILMKYATSKISMNKSSAAVVVYSLDHSKFAQGRLRNIFGTEEQKEGMYIRSRTSQDDSAMYLFSVSGKWICG